MHKHYIINDQLEFHPVDGTLRDLNNPQCVVVLNSPAGRCLLLLIERAGTIVTQQECMDIVWQSRGMLVSLNTYYQNISILRKGLKKIGLKGEPVVTIPRIGLTLASDIRITVKEVPEFVPAQYEAARENDEAVASAPATMRPTSSVAAVIPRWWRLIILFTAMLLTGVGIISHGFFRDDYFGNEYYFANATGNCRIYLANHIRTSDERARALAYAELFIDSCANYPWMYIGWYASLPRASVIRCDRSMKEPNRCISDYFIEDR